MKKFKMDMKVTIGMEMSIAIKMKEVVDGGEDEDGRDSGDEDGD